MPPCGANCAKTGTNPEGNLDQTPPPPSQPIPSPSAPSGSSRSLDFPPEWGSPPAIQTADYRELPGAYKGYFGSSTLHNWILNNMKNYHNNQVGRFPPSWGEIPRKQTKDRRDLGDFGYGSGTLLKWINENISKQHGGNIPTMPGPTLPQPRALNPVFQTRMGGNRRY